MASKKDVEQALDESKVEKEKASQVLKILEQLEEEKNAAKEEKPKYRDIGFIMSGDEYNGIPLVERPIFVARIEEDEDHNLVLEKYRAAAIDYNNSKKGKRVPVEKFSDIAPLVGYKFYTIHDLKKIKEEILLLVEVDNKNFLTYNQ